MKALKSELAKSLLADPVAAKKLQEWLMIRRDIIIDISIDGKDVKVTPVIVPKAG